MHGIWKRPLRRALALLLALAAGMSLGVRAFALDAADAAKLSGAAVLAEQSCEKNAEAIRLLVSQCMELLPEGDPVRGTLQSVLILLDSGPSNGGAIALLLRTVVDAQFAQPQAEPQAEPEPEEESEAPADGLTPWPERSNTKGLPVFEVPDYTKALIRDTVTMDVPRDWGNNDSGRALISYSPVNASGAISPAAGTLTISYFPAEGQDSAAAFDSYTRSIAGMSVTTDLDYTEASVAGLPARKIDFTMRVGANQFDCETVCFAYEDTIYAIEMMQGRQTEFDYFPVYDRVVTSTEITEGGPIAQTPATEQPAAQELPALPDQDGPEALSFTGDMSSFQYAINGRVYPFPTAIRDLREGDLPLNRQMSIPYDFRSDGDMPDGLWNEIVNTQYYYFDNGLHKEMCGVTNLSHTSVPLGDCVLTVLIDTEGDCVDVVLPGNVRVGGSESDLLRGFPWFSGKPLDGIASFIGNDLLYACNVRDDGCSGYVLIRNDAPYYSAVSIICSGGLIQEISFECLGSVRAHGVFLD